MKKYKWTQPSCRECWDIKNPGRRPTTINDRQGETCCYCGKMTGSGIYIRVDPAACDYPTLED